MQQLKKVLDYFIEYEWEHRLANITLNKNNHINITREEAQNILSLQKRLINRKFDRIKNIVENINFVDLQKKEQVVKELEQLYKVEKIQDLNIEEILLQEYYKYSDNYSKDIKKVKEILQDNQVMVLFPILANGENKVPLICFEMQLIENSFQIQKYHLQIEALRIIIAAILGCEIPEVDIVMEDFQGFSRSLTALQSNDFFEIVNLVNEELKGKFLEYEFESIWTYKNYNRWAITEEIVLTMETFGDMIFPPFQDEISAVRCQCEEKAPVILEKYLFGNNERKSTEDINITFWDGSYTDKFGINEKQAKVVSAYQNTQLLAVNGPPGTGKTTVLKEIIADNIVKKTKRLLEIWNDPWQLIGVNNQQVYISPLNGECEYSMLIASTNNKAVDNIGVELLNELEYFSEVINESEKEYKGILCAKLGNVYNMDEFRSLILIPLINYLGTVSYDEEEAIDYVTKFRTIEEELHRYNDANSKYLYQREQVCGKLRKLKFFEGQINENEVIKTLTQIKENISCIQNKKQQRLKTIKELKELKNEYVQRVLELDSKLESICKRLNENQCCIQEIEKKSKYILVGKILERLSERKLGTKESINIETEKLVSDKEFLVKVKNQNKEDFEKAEKECKRQEEIFKICEEELKENMKKKEALENWIQLKESFLEVSQNYSNDLQWDDSVYKFNVCSEITVRRNHLFILSLKIMELYIKKHAWQIKFNLEKVYPDNWFQPFYRRNFEYDENYVQYIKAMWETIFLCFPVVTTTLHALDRKRFHMIHEIFDTLFIDEAGQALIHTVVGPLVRFRRAVVVGDVHQLEPIRKVRESSILERIDLPLQIKEKIDIEQNSVQNAADLGSEIYDILNQKEVGIVLEEHRRCENSIVQFSNQYVYDKCLKIVKKDEKKAFLGHNFCMVDIRGVKNNKNENISEVNACERIVKELIQIHGNEYKNKIGIITPYKGQERLLRKRLPDIGLGTVHVFQGQEKEVIIMSMVVDNSKKNSGIYFVGNKPNCLNVAFTRAKKQLILVGNYEACNESGNYLSLSMKCLRENGRLYSMYEADTINKEQVEEKHWKQFWNIMSCYKNAILSYQDVLKKYVRNGMILGAKNHHEFLEEMLLCFSKSVKIISPWITANVVNQNFLKYIQEIKKQCKTIKICFGHHKADYTLDEIDKIVNKDWSWEQKEKHIRAIEKLRNIIEADLQYQPPLHSKILIIDDEFMIITSHNWLSNSGKGENPKDEVGCLIYDKSAIEFINKRYKLN